MKAIGVSLLNIDTSDEGNHRSGNHRAANGVVPHVQANITLEHAQYSHGETVIRCVGLRIGPQGETSVPLPDDRLRR